MAQVKIGEMNKEVRFKMPITGHDPDTNEQTAEFVTSSYVWAKIEQKAAGSDEIGNQGKKTDVNTVVFSMYFIEGMQPNWKILHGERQYEILAILPLPDLIFMQVEAKLFDDG